MKKLNKAVSEYINCMTLVGTKPLIVFVENDFLVTYYYSKPFVQSKIGEVIYG